MTKKEFVEKLRVALSGKVSAALVEENVAYYEEYIEAQIRRGKPEEEVMEMLGDSRLIARTIVQTNGSGGDFAENASYRSAGNEDSYYDSTSYTDTGNHGGSYSSNGYSGNRNEIKVRTIPGWLWAVIIIVIIVLVLSAVFSLISFLLPMVLPILIVVFLVKLFRDWLN